MNIDEEKKLQAVLYLSLATCRGAISRLLEEGGDPGVDAACQALVSSEIDSLCSLVEGVDDSFKDWDRFLSEEEIRGVKGVDFSDVQWEEFQRLRKQHKDASRRMNPVPDGEGNS